jgi:hypothetical protein
MPIRQLGVYAWVLMPKYFHLLVRTGKEPLILISGLQPPDGHQFFDRFKLRVPGQYPPLMSLGQGRAEGVGVSDGV